MGRSRRRVERIEGIAFDAILVAVAVAASEEVVQDWLFEHPAALYHGLAALHLIACPALLVAIMKGHGKAEQEMRRTDGPNLIGWAIAFVWGGSFVIPGVLGLIFHTEAWEMMTTIFGPLVLFGLWVTALVMAERRGWIKRARAGEPKPWWSVQALAIVTWAYLLWLETMLIVAATKTGPLVQVGLPLGVLIDYLPIRVAMYYVRDSSKWERFTIAATVLHLLYRIGSA